MKASAVLLAVFLVAAGAPALSAQDLGRIEALGADGRTAAARDSLLVWWEAEWDGASRAERERALWLRGLLTLDPAEASGSFRRIVTEYPGGAYTGDALDRLGSLAAAVGDTVAARQWFSLLARDHAGSTLGDRAQSWLAGDRSAMVGVGRSAGAGEAAATTTATARPERVPDPVPPTVEPRPDTPPEVPADTLPETPPETPWTVQLGAFSSEDTAREIAGEARAAGFEVRVVLVEGSDLWRVRSGRFTEADGARPLLDGMRSAGLVAAIVPGADQEVSGG